MLAVRTGPWVSSSAKQPGTATAADRNAAKPLQLGSKTKNDKKDAFQAAAANDAIARAHKRQASSGSEYEDDQFELGESIANLGGSAKKQENNQLDIDDIFNPGRGGGKDPRASDKDSEPPAFDDNYDDYMNNF